MDILSFKISQMFSYTYLVIINLVSDKNAKVHSQCTWRAKLSRKIKKEFYESARRAFREVNTMVGVV